MLLNAMRSGATSIFAKMLFSVLLCAAVLGLAMMDYNGMFRLGMHRDVVATVAGEEIPGSVFDSEAKRILSRQSMNPKQAYQMGYIDQILQSEIAEKLISRGTYDLGIQVSDDVIAAQINQLLTPYVAKSNMSKRDALKSILTTQGISEAEFAQSMRTETADNLLHNALQSGAKYVPQQEITDLYLFQHEDRTLKFVVLPNDAMKDYKDPVDAILLPFYETAKQKYAIPETRSFSMLVLTADNIKKTTDVSDEDVKKTYDDSPASYNTPEKRVMQQAVFKDEAVAKAAAEKVKGGASLKDAAGTPDAWLGEQTFEKQGLAPEIAGPAFAAEKGAIIGPVHTALGWHVLVLRDIQPSRAQPFAEVKDQIRKDLLAGTVSDALYKTSGKLDDELAGGAALEDVAKDMGLTIKDGPVRADGSTADSHEGFKDYPEDRPVIMKTAFQLTEGETSSMQELKDGSFAVIRADKVTPKSYKAFADVKADLKKEWIADQQDVLNKDKASAALQDLDSGKKTLDEIAQDNHTNVQSLSLKRSDDPTAPLTATAKEKFFTIGKGTYAAASVKDGYMVGQLAAIKLPDASKISADDLKDLTKAATEAAQDEYLMAYVDYLRTKYGVTVDEAYLKQMYGSADNANGDDGSGDQN